MPAKKKRPLRKSVAGLPPSIAAQLTDAARIKRARAEREDRELYERYRDNPERQMIAPAFVQLAREGGVIAALEAALLDEQKRNKDILANLQQKAELITELNEELRAMAARASTQNAQSAVELSKQLAEVQERLIAEKHQLRKQLAAEKTSVEFWIYEASRWRREAEVLRREEAASRVERGVS